MFFHGDQKHYPLPELIFMDTLASSHVSFPTIYMYKICLCTCYKNVEVRRVFRKVVRLVEAAEAERVIVPLT